MLTIPAQLEPGLLAWWDATAGPAGRTLRSRSRFGSRFDGELVNMEPADRWVADRYGWCLDFGGGNEHVRIAPADRFDPYFAGTAHHGSIAVLFRRGPVSATEILISLEGAIVLELDSAGHLIGFATATSANAAGTPQTYDDGAWHLAVFAWSPGVQWIDVDGTRRAEDVPAALYDLTALNRNTVIGAAYTGTYYAFGGQIALAAIWNRTLSGVDARRLDAAVRNPVRPRRPAVVGGLPVGGPYQPNAGTTYLAGAAAGDHHLAAACAGHALNAG